MDAPTPPRWLSIPSLRNKQHSDMLLVISIQQRIRCFELFVTCILVLNLAAAIRKYSLTPWHAGRCAQTLRIFLINFPNGGSLFSQFQPEEEMIGQSTILCVGQQLLTRIHIFARLGMASCICSVQTITYVRVHLCHRPTLNSISGLTQCASGNCV